MEPRVGIVIGSQNDRELVAPAVQIFEEFQVPHEVSVISAHRAPERVRSYAQSAEGRGLRVLIAAAGYAAHLPGVLAAWSPLPVIGVPLPTSDLHGVDSLLSVVQMPGGVPVACTGIGKSGAKNAALLAIQILAIEDVSLRTAYRTYREKLAAQ
ncbi:MAG: 5-(carboxyamino)imidazole ribonucleotide mutase [Dehalococcoidia bacterium]|jgi:5-(carboxyamino)imidazole ribonucleotide mutase|nr:5-(carboxyamino)imidazole ribonucleotide mutase [Dehalococcoidia bacterium]